MTEPDLPAPALRTQLTLLAAGGLGGIFAAELALRLAGGGLPHLGVFEERAGTIVLAAEAEARVRRADGVTYAVRTDARGWRVPVAGPRLAPGAAGDDACAWAIVGDSQVMGSGVEGEASFPSRLGACNLGVPGYGVMDALESVPANAGLRGVVVVANQANDWDEGLAGVRSRYAVRGGWLVRRENADTLAATLWGTPLSRVHLLHLIGSVVLSSLFAPDGEPAPAWADAEAATATTQAIAGAIRDFATSHPALAVVVAWLPVDVAAVDRAAGTSPFAEAAARARRPPREDRRLRDGLFAALSCGEAPSGAPAGLRCVDLLPGLVDRSDAFLSYDYHLSEVGHALVATALAPELTR